MKIERVINSCHDCRFMQKTQEIGGNTFFAAICNYSQHQEEETIEKPFLIEVGRHWDMFNNPMGIPNNCPLKDYNNSVVS